MELRELYKLIGLEPEVVSRLERIERDIRPEEIQGCLGGMLDIRTAALAYERLKALLMEDAGGIKMLWCQLECARRAWDRYRERGIPEDVYRDTMACFSRFLAECREREGRLLFDRGWWTYRQTSMILFRLGALEYELRERERGCVVAVHIPSDADFSEASVDASLERAERFFCIYYPNDRRDMYVCNSWLLSPALEPLLPEGSHIRAFQKRFRVIREDREDREYRQWLFRVPEDTADGDLPEETSLQRNVKKLLLSGGAVGSACGIMIRKADKP